jgi:uncharacterized protein YgbK (DUF1537 family)
MAGGAEFFGALLPSGPPPVVDLLSLTGRQLFVCGSASDGTRKFVTTQAEMNVPVLCLPSRMAETGVLDPAELNEMCQEATRLMALRNRVLIHVGLPLVRDERVAERLALQLVQVAERVLRATSVSQVFAEGGATAIALASRMGWSRLKVVAELAQGVAVLSPVVDKAPNLIIKPGSYAWPDTVLPPPPSPSAEIA